MVEAVDCYVERLVEHQKSLEGTRERLISLLEQTHRDYAALQNVWKLAPTDFLQGITSIKVSTVIGFHTGLGFSTALPSSKRPHSRHRGSLDQPSHHV
ncbi:MAG: hypothetical protein KVP17_002538 [Porospora cf. gigantea B]|uniref:uncharacterized protein n=1 Tax=Porospora cf. gigantea B TaxID=2853592 RepID=UPI003571B424|nr:MAG: hypothetical protein KVP17_002538 [Porospora cf. gigantea B]